MLGRYNAQISIRNDGFSGSGYSVSFDRSDLNFNNSRITLRDGATEVGVYNPSIQFGEQLGIKVDFRADGSVIGAIRQGVLNETFSFSARSIASSGSNVFIGLGGAGSDGSGSTQHRLDDFSIATLPLAPTPLPPPSEVPNKTLKILAAAEAELFEKSAEYISVISAFIGGKATAAAQGIIKGVEATTKSLATFFGLREVKKFVVDSDDPVALAAFVFGEGAFVHANCLLGLKTISTETALTLCGAEYTGFAMSEFLAPKLIAYAVDPPDPSYKSIFPVVVPKVDIENPLFQPIVDAIAGAGAYLDGVNESFDRYSAAYAANDQVSGELQLGAISMYFGEYSNNALRAQHQLKSVADSISFSLDLNANYDPAFLLLVQSTLLNEGFSPDVIDLLDGLGLDETGIGLVKNDILNFDQHSVSGTLSDALASDASRFGRLAVVPIAGTLWLLIVGLLGLGLLRIGSRN